MITSVAQIPIESIVFPPVTLCPKVAAQEGQIVANWSIEEIVQSCSFTQNSQDTGQVCDRVQVWEYTQTDLLTYLLSSSSSENNQ